MKTSSKRTRVLIFIGLTLAGVALFFGGAIQRHLLVTFLIRESAPSADVVRETIDAADDPAPLFWKFWNSKKIPHRIMVLDYLRLQLASDSELAETMKPLLLEAAQDPDASARELVFGLLSRLGMPELLDCTWSLLEDPDPELRLLGLRYLRQAKEPQVRRTVALLDDADLRVAGTAATILRKWSGEDFGVRLHFTVPDAKTEEVDPKKLQQLQEGLQQWREWWKKHQGGYPPAPAAPEQPKTPQKLLAEDFALPDLSGQTVRLSSFKGKIVLLNFWATWCTACLVEIPSLIELQKKYESDLAVLGISLDGRPDPHGHAHGQEDSHDHHDHSHEDHQAAAQSSLGEVRAKVERVVRRQGINYIMLLNPSGDIGARYNGHELPTNVIIDRDGSVRRRFIGKRDLATLEAMIRLADSR